MVDPYFDTYLRSHQFIWFEHIICLFINVIFTNDNFITNGATAEKNGPVAVEVLFWIEDLSFIAEFRA